MRNKNLILSSVLLWILSIHTFSLSAQNVATVIEVLPAPGQFVNVLPAYVAGDDSTTMVSKAQQMFDNGSFISLGGCGGYVTLAYPQGIGNAIGQTDFKVIGNAFANNAEPGVIMVMKDENKNGLPDDTWYEIWGSEHSHEETNVNFTITYYKPSAEKEAETLPTDYIFWKSSEGQSGYMPKNRFHTQSYWPSWVSSDSMVYSSTRLRSNAVDVNGDGSYISFATFNFGYADNCSNSSDCAEINIEWAADKDGVSANLDTIHFVKVATGVQHVFGNTGEVSTEVGGIELVRKSTALPEIPLSEITMCFTNNMLYIENGEGAKATLFTLDGKLLHQFMVTHDNFYYTMSESISAIYIVRLEKNHEIKYHKIIKK